MPNPILIDPATLAEPLVYRDDKNEIIFAVVPLISVQEAFTVSNVSNKQVAEFCHSVYLNKEKQEKAPRKATKTTKSSRVQMTIFGYNDSTHCSPRGLYLHPLRKEGYNKSKSRSFRIPFLSPPKAGASLVKQLGSTIQGIYKHSVCDSPRDKQVLERKVALMEEWNKSIRTLTGDSASLISNVVGCSHTTSIAACASVSSIHKDAHNASSHFGGIPDFHCCLTDSPNTVFCVELSIQSMQCTKILVRQRKFAVTFFYAATCHHGSFEMPWHTPTSANASQDQSHDSYRVYLTFLSKVTMPYIHHSVQYHKAAKIATVTYDNSENGQLKLSRDFDTVTLSLAQMKAHNILDLEELQEKQKQELSIVEGPCP